VTFVTWLRQPHNRPQRRAEAKNASGTRSPGSAGSGGSLALWSRSTGAMRRGVIVLAALLSSAVGILAMAPSASAYVTIDQYCILRAFVPFFVSSHENDRDPSLVPGSERF
jgi:hypothetical protein